MPELTAVLREIVIVCANCGKVMKAEAMQAQLYPELVDDSIVKNSLGGSGRIIGKED